MRYIGLTGGMGCGKSTVAKIIEDLGAIIIDADFLAREVVKPGEIAYLEIVDNFGAAILNPDKSLNRKKLSQIVFNDLDSLTFLNKTTHSQIHHLRDKILKDIYEKFPDSFVVYVVPLLFENNMQKYFQKTVLVSLDSDAQLSRLVNLRGFTKEDVLLRLKQQMPQKQKFLLADLIINNNNEIEETKNEVKKVFEILVKLPQIDLKDIPLGHT